MRTYH